MEGPEIVPPQTYDYSMLNALALAEMEGHSGTNGILPASLGPVDSYESSPNGCKSTNQADSNPTDEWTSDPNNDSRISMFLHLSCPCLRFTHTLQTYDLSLSSARYF
jgi:hypothetical protein